MNEKLKEVLNSLGALSEMCRMFYNCLLDQRFTSIQALELTKGLIVAALTTGGGSNEPD